MAASRNRAIRWSLVPVPEGSRTVVRSLALDTVSDVNPTYERLPLIAEPTLWELCHLPTKSLRFIRGPCDEAVLAVRATSAALSSGARLLSMAGARPELDSSLYAPLRRA